eukprot:TRINITY_DN65786_c8_g7_i1.p1 TRINITY_DN65786_c8_g7~~TRINITY_DN65786_c8_g7_i1.p1  ORF type:complete len:313 (-),score=139.89 TRINITY_DN65786_c8_g7_i1:376-1314(-)
MRLPPLLLALSCLVLAAVPGSVAAGRRRTAVGIATPPVATNPFKDVLVEPPVYQPPKREDAFNLYEIPELPDRFDVHFTYTSADRTKKNMEGRWIYDYSVRKTKIEYYPGGRNSDYVIGYFFNYLYGQESVMRYELGGPDGSKCTTFDLVVPFARMFSPRAWRRVDIDNIDLMQQSFYEAERQSAYVALAGTWKNLRLSLDIYTNSTLKQIVISGNSWSFHNQTDMSTWDQFAIANSPALRELVEPKVQAIYAGSMVEEVYLDYQAEVPFLLIKPTRNPAKLAQTMVRAKNRAKLGGKGKGKGKGKRGGKGR